ncbi:NAD(P)-binding protein [Aspergillus desertorum]
MPSRVPRYEELRKVPCNTGKAVTQTLSTLLKASEACHQTPSTRSDKVIEYNWTDITTDWLREQEVVRAFIAPHNAPHQFGEESAFHAAALKAGVEYIVRISSTAPNVGPDFDAYYPRQHWAIEALLGSAEFSALKWTSLQPNVFLNYYLVAVAEYIKQCRQTGEQGQLRLIGAKTAPVAPAHPDEVGILAAHLLAKRDLGAHDRAKYVVNGPEDMTDEPGGLGRPVYWYKSEGRELSGLSYLDAILGSGFGGPGQSKTVMGSIRHAVTTMWKGKCNASTTSKEVLEIAAPKRTPVEVLKSLLEE